MRQSKIKQYELFYSGLHSKCRISRQL